MKTKKEEKMKVITINIPESYLDFIRSRMPQKRSEIFRLAMAYWAEHQCGINLHKRGKHAK